MASAIGILGKDPVLSDKVLGSITMGTKHNVARPRGSSRCTEVSPGEERKPRRASDDIDFVKAFSDSPIAPSVPSDLYSLRQGKTVAKKLGRKSKSRPLPRQMHVCHN